MLLIPLNHCKAKYGIVYEGIASKTLIVHLDLLILKLAALINLTTTTKKAVKHHPSPQIKM